MTEGPPRDSIVVQDVWFDHRSGVGQTVMKHPGRLPRGELKRAAVMAARSELRARLPIEVSEPVIAGRLRRGPRLPDGRRHAFVDWRLGSPLWRIRNSAEATLLRVYTRLTPRKGRN